MQKNAIIAIVVAVIMLGAGIGIGFLIGNNNNKGDSTPTLVMASACDYPLYEYIASDGDYAGIDIDIVHEAANRMGMKFKVNDMTFDGVISSVQSKKADIGGSAITITEERKQNVTFSDSYSQARQYIVVKSDSTVSKSADLAGKKIGVQLNTTGDYAANEAFPGNVTAYKVTSDVFGALDAGKVDAAVVDSGPAQVYVNTHSGFKIIDWTELETEYYGFIFNKDNTQLSNLFGLVLAQMKADGTIDKIVNYYNTHNDGKAISYWKTV